MPVGVPLAVLVVLSIAGLARAQQVQDPGFKPPVPRPAYEAGTGPRVAIDEAHHNFHTATGRYEPFAELLRRDGYRVSALDRRWSRATLEEVEVLVVANALNERNAEDWTLPTPSAFTADEIAALRAWVERGGSLLLIADHMPFAGAANDLGLAFGIEFSNGFVVPGHAGRGVPDVFTYDSGLKDTPATRGRTAAERVTEVATFTGSAFKVPANATPVIVLGAGSISHLTRRSLQVTSDTPSEDVAGWCQVALLDAGRGRVAVSGEAAMFSAQLAGPKRQPMGMNSPAAPRNYQFLLNILHWLTRVPETDGVTSWEPMGSHLESSRSSLLCPTRSRSVTIVAT